MSPATGRWHAPTMTVYPDGDALSERELRILHQIERHLEKMDADDPDQAEDEIVVPLHIYALYTIVTEVALMFAAYVSMVALATIAATVWTAPVRTPAGRV